MIEINNIDYKEANGVIVSFLNTETNTVTYVRLVKPLNDDGSVNQEILKPMIESTRSLLEEKINQLKAATQIMKPVMPAPFEPEVVAEPEVEAEVKVEEKPKRRTKKK